MADVAPAASYQPDDEGRHMLRSVRLTRSFISALRSLLVVFWIFLWIIPVAVALELSVEVATAALAIVTAAFVIWNVVLPLSSRPRMVALVRLRPWRRYVGWLTLAALALLILAFATLVLHEQLAEWRFLPKLPNDPELVPPEYFTHPLGFVAMSVAVVIVTPLIEEFGCRGRMQHRLERDVGLLPAIMIPAIVFSLLHGVVVAPHHLVFALFVGWVVWRTGSVWTAVYVHALNNFAALVLVYVTHDRPTWSQGFPSWLWPYAIPVGAIAGAGLVAIGWRIHQIAQHDRPRAGAWSRRRPVEPNLTPALRG
jgi:membrane protease YdiL (CAAX protease family)